MRGWWQDLTDLVLPTECGGCGRPRTVLCPKCRAALSGAVPSRVRPVPEPPGLPAVHAAARYADEVRAVLLAHKERGALSLATPLGTALAGAVRVGVREAWGGGVGGGGGAPSVRAPLAGAPTGESASHVDRPLLLVPVPSARRAVRARGHDPARRIALAAAGELRRGGVAARVVAVLRQRRAVVDQAGLNSRQRLENLAGALGVVPGGGRLLRGGRVVLVDDLMTTGASLAEAARAVWAAREPWRDEGADWYVTGADAGADACVTGSNEGADAYVTGPEPGRGGAVAVAGGWSAGDARGYRHSPGPESCGDVARAVYPAAARESRGERITGPVEEEADLVRDGRGGAGASSAGDLICAAVVAASPDSFETNRN
ncbi:ComF family protein [Streptomyces sp. NPDC006476]|uniref:ComF family protein n=1 Tax=Streptomyces sp. NPDC006476 TaxID=3157175 RepID=UPI0033AEE340